MPFAICWPTNVSSSPTATIEKITTTRDAIRRPAPIRISQWTTGVSSALANSATISGSTTTAKKLSTQSVPSTAAATTRIRQDQAAARSNAHGTWAREKFEAPPSITGSSSTRRESRISCHCAANRSERRSSRAAVASSSTSCLRVWARSTARSAASSARERRASRIRPNRFVATPRA